MRGSQHEKRCYYIALMGRLVDEIGKVDSSTLAAEDRNIYEATIFSDQSSSSIEQTSLAVVARLSVQSVVFEALVMLLDEGFISLSALHDSIDLANVQDVSNISHILMECFEFGTCLYHCPQEVFMCQSYAVPVRWWGYLIVRRAKLNLEKILSTIEIKKLFSAFDWDKYREIWPHDETFSVNPEASITDRERTGYVVMHLPMKIVEVDVLPAVHNAFDNFDELVQTFQDLRGRHFGFEKKEWVPVGRSLE